MNNEFKQKLQEKEFLALKDHHRIILKWATGCGKSKMAIDLINYTATTKYTKPVRILFLVAERAHIQNWEDEFHKWSLRRDKVMTDVACYASLKKYNHFYYDIIVMDEGHHAFTEKRLALLEEMPVNPNRHVYILSATLSVAKVMMAEDIFGKFITSTVTLKDAIKNDILPDPKVYVVAMELDNLTPNQRIQVGKDPDAPMVDWKDRYKYLAKKKPCIIRCTERQKYIYYTDTMEYWKQRYERSHNEFQRNLWVSTGSLRKRFLGELKTPVIENLIGMMPRRKRYVCFCASVAQATQLNEENTISSKRSSRLNQMIIDAFNKKKLHNIFAVGMITEGMNLAAIEAGIIVQLDGKERLFIQKFGRSLRAEDPVTFIFYYKNTQDENYLKLALENIDEKYIQYLDENRLSEIKL